MQRIQFSAAAAVAEAITIGVAGCLVGAASDVGRTSARPKLVDQVGALCLLRQLEVGSHQFLILCLQSVAEILHGVGIDKSAGGLTLSVDSGRDFTGVFGVLIPDSINVAVGLAAALLSGEPVFSNTRAYSVEAGAEVSLDTIEALEHGSVLGIKAVTQAVLNAADTVLNLIVVQTVVQFRPGQSTLSSVATETTEAVTAPGQKEEQEKYPGAIAPEHPVIVSVLQSQSISYRQAATTSFHSHMCTSCINFISTQGTGIEIDSMPD